MKPGDLITPDNIHLLGVGSVGVFDSYGVTVTLTKVAPNEWRSQWLTNPWTDEEVASPDDWHPVHVVSVVPVTL